MKKISAGNESYRKRLQREMTAAKWHRNWRNGGGVK
jgi:hypothetical protein